MMTQKSANHPPGGAPQAAAPKIFVLLKKYPDPTSIAQQLGGAMINGSGISGPMSVLRGNLLVTDAIIDPKSTDHAGHIIHVSSNGGAPKHSNIWKLHSAAFPGELSPLVDKIQHYDAMAGELEAARSQVDELEAKFNTLNQLSSMLNIAGVSLSAEENVDVLLQKVVAQAMTITNSDAGSLYLRERNAHGNEVLTFAVAKNDSVEIPFKSFQFPVDDKTIAGYVLMTGRPINAPDAKIIPQFNPIMEEKYGYRIGPMLTVPLRNTRGETIGVLQLINKKKDKGVNLADKGIVEDSTAPYSHLEKSYISVLAMQAAIAIEKAKLQKEMELLPEALIKTVLVAFERRDPISHGHSHRVTAYSMALARAVNESTERNGPFRGVFFDDERMKRFKTSALLHDIGKIGVPESILLKSTKLPDDRIRLIEQRFEIAKHTAATGWSENGMAAQLDSDLAFINKINRTNTMSEEEYGTLRDIGSRAYVTLGNEVRSLLEPDELEHLSVRSGNLTSTERAKVQEHVMHTLEILQEAFKTYMREVPGIAYLHHEMMDGSGYPFGKVGADVPVESRIIAVADVFDALTSIDRPYRKRMPVKEAIAEMKTMHLDPDLLELFITRRCYDAVDRSAGAAKQ